MTTIKNTMQTVIARMILTLIGLAAFPAMFTAMFYIHDAQDRAKRESFYRQHALLRELLNAATDANGSIRSSSPEAAQVLLKHTRGDSAAEVFDKLVKEGLHCQRINESSPVIACGVSEEARHEHSVHGWHIVLNLDESRRVSDARVTMTK